MNDIRRRILKSLEALSDEYPDMRFGQLVVNVSNWAAQVPDSLWDLDDERFLEAVSRHLAKRGATPPIPAVSGPADLPDVLSTTQRQEGR